MVKRKKTDIVQFKVRLRESLRQQLEDAARAKDISLNSEIVARLEQSFVQASLQDNFDRRFGVLEELIKTSQNKGEQRLLPAMSDSWQKLVEQRRYRMEHSRWLQTMADEMRAQGRVEDAERLEAERLFHESQL